MKFFFKSCLKILLHTFIIIFLIAGCNPPGRGHSYTLKGQVWWGNKLAITYVEVSAGGWDVGIGSGVDTLLTDSSGSYMKVFYSYYGSAVDYTVRAMDSLGTWSPYKHGFIETADPEIVDFHL